MDSFEIFIEKFTITGGSITTAVVIPLLFPLYHWMSHLSREAQYLHLQNELACIFVQMFMCLRGSIVITLVIPLFWESFSNDTFLAPVLHLKVPCYFPHIPSTACRFEWQKNENHNVHYIFIIFFEKSHKEFNIFVWLQISELRLCSTLILVFLISQVFRQGQVVCLFVLLFLTLSPFNIESTLPWKRTGQVHEVVCKTKPT